MFTGPVGPVEVFFYWPEAVFGIFYWPGAIGLPLVSSPAKDRIYPVLVTQARYVAPDVRINPVLARAGLRYHFS